jgi:hypothetical protein
VTYLSFDEASGAADDPVGGNDGTLGSGVTRVTGPAGLGSAVDFDGTVLAVVDLGPGVGNNFATPTASRSRR